MKVTNLAEVQALVARGAVFFLNHSAGKDSQAMTALVRAVVPDAQLVVIHADLGRCEWTGVQEHIRATTAGLPLHVIRAVDKNGEEKDLLDAIEKRAADLVARGKKYAPWPSSGQRFCTSDFKRGPLQKLIRAIMKARGAKLAVNCMGLRADESDKRECGLDKVAYEQTGAAVTLGLSDDLSRAGREVYDWLPIHDLKVDDVWAVIAAAGQKRHHAYDEGMSRLSCCFCILAKTSDLRRSAELNPRLYAQYVALERRTGKTMKSGKSLEEITGIKADMSLLEEKK